MSFMINKHGSELVREYNRSLIFNLIRSRGPISRASLTRLTKMSPTSVGRIVQELINEGLICETGQTHSGIGKPAILLEIHPEGVFAIGIDLDVHRIEIGLVSIEGEVIHKRIIENGNNASKEDVINAMGRCVDDLWKDLDEALRNRVVGLGVSVPGPVIWPEGIMRFSPQFGWSNVPLRQILEQWTGMLVLIENNVKAAASAEMLFGKDPELSDFVIVLLGSGIGAAVVSEGKLFRGVDNIAGEIGHMTINPEGPVCDCGRRGCLQAYVCASGIRRLAGVPLDDVIALSKAGDERCQGLLDQASTYLAMGVSNLVNLYNPRLVLLYGFMLEVWPELLELLREKTPHFLWQVASEQIRIVPADFVQDDVSVISAASIVLRDFLLPPVFIRSTAAHLAE